MKFAPRGAILGLAAILAALPILAIIQDAWAGRVSDIRNTKHNLSSTSSNDVKATSEDEICVFCHTPHAASQNMTPLWNRQASSATYTTYRSSSMDATSGTIGLDQPDGTSKLCLSCHDGTIAIGQVNVLDGKVTTGAMPMDGTGTDGVMPDGKGDTTGNTRKLGTNLTNDHPISFVYDDDLAGRDGELQAPSTSGGNPRLIDSRTIGYKPAFPLENGKLQCTTCHDPHIRSDDPAEGNIKFLRHNRLQKAAPGPTFDASTDILCLGCHTKAGWEGSAHADPAVANEAYTNDAAAQREFPVGTKVWEAACLNCHDTHAVQGTRRLLRDGTDGAINGQNTKAGGNSAIEQTCYQCHSKSGGVEGVVLTGQGGATFEVPDIKTDFTMKTYRMPIAETPEVHDIGNSPLEQAGKDFIEKPDLLAQRHAECSDCHNPHRVIRNKLFNGTGSTASGTHNHASPHSNIASGVLKGSWGVEPVYGSATFGTEPTFPASSIKRGDPGSSTSTAVGESYVTREYQICLKCHSNYAYGSTPPDLGLSDGGTPSGTNGMTRYTNQAMEFQAPSTHRGAPTGNHRSWHPVMDSTGRTTALRGGMVASSWLTPWNTAIGSQTMYCSDCHGSETSGATVVPDGNSGTEHGNAWGPHGSNNAFILKGKWDRDTGNGTPDDLCFKCHSYTQYATASGSSKSGFSTGSDNLHARHVNRFASFSSAARWKCRLCHVAVPHGWKNKALLVDLNNVGAEAGLPPGTEVRKDTDCVKQNSRCVAYEGPPYYMGAALKVVRWASSGSWKDDDCGSKRGGRDSMNKDRVGKPWMGQGVEACMNLP